ncbi:MAG: substrate-binding domain-containing protein [Bacillota bacterium]|nr:substrate-binding domain-containing protein [Bacillota bacterium]
MEKDPFSEFRVSVELDGEKRISGNNLFDLLEKITRYGSISRAASEMGISYRYSWGLIQAAEKALGLALVNKQIGGYEGGGTSLTREGKELLGQYKEFKGEVDTQLNRFVKKAKQAKNAAHPTKDGSGQGDGSSGQIFQRHLLLASTMEPVETGLLDVLEGAFYQSSGVLVRHIALGSGRALQIAKSGRVDMALTHAPELEEEFMEEGWGESRFPVMANDFVLVGPVSDPAEIAKIDPSGGTKEAFRKVALSRSPFISRGDHSGTHLRELKIWESAGISPEGEWYLKSSGVVGNLGILRLALEKKAYTLVDRATFLLSRSFEKMIRIFTGTEEGNALTGELENIFSLTLVNPERIPTVNSEDALLFAGWIQGKEAQQVIAGFGQESFGRPLFSIVNPFS